MVEGEPEVRPELLLAPQLLLTPHIASATQSARLATLIQITENTQAALAGLRPSNLLSQEAFV